MKHIRGKMEQVNSVNNIQFGKQRTRRDSGHTRILRSRAPMFTLNFNFNFRNRFFFILQDCLFWCWYARLKQRTVFGLVDAVRHYSIGRFNCEKRNCNHKNVAWMPRNYRPYSNFRDSACLRNCLMGLVLDNEGTCSYHVISKLFLDWEKPSNVRRKQHYPFKP